MATAGHQLVAGMAAPRGLPAQASALIGREAEVARICELLGSDDVRLVTLTGPGGVGKSRLGLHATATSAEVFADGVAFVSLGALQDAALVANEIAAGLGVADAGDLAPLDRIRMHLRERETLLLLDGFEQLLAAAGVVAELLAACPQLKLLVTSRAALEIAGEHQLRVPPLAAFPANDDDDPRSLSPAASLFVARAKALDQDFELTPPCARAVAEICRRLDGLPLAIELAAARVRLLPPEAMVKRLDNRLALLTAGRRDAPRRQQTMRATIAWSYELLTPVEQRLFRLLSVFAGGCTLGAAESVAGEDVLELVDSLLTQSMLVRLGDLGELRVGMLETLQEYAGEQLAATGERDVAERAHADWCLGLARAAESALWGPQQQAWLGRIDRELPNLRAALRWLVDNDGADQAGELAAALERFWLMRGHLAEGRAWLEAGLAAGGGTPTARARRLSVASTLASYGGEREHARAYADRARQAAEECGDPEMLAQALCAAGQVARFDADAGESRASYEQAVAILRTLDRPARLAEALTRFAAGMLHAYADVAEMTELAAEALELARDAGDTEGALCASCVLAHCLISVDEARATALLDDVHETCRADGTSRYKARGVYLQGVISLNKGEYARGLAQLEEAAAIAREFGQGGWLSGYCVPILARAHLLTGHPDEAARLLAAADRELASSGGWRSRWLQADDGGGIDATRGALADPRYDAAWAAGATLTVEQALDAARSVAATAEPAAGDKLPDLTARELDVLRLLTGDLSDAQIAQELVVSRRTVHAHLRSIYRKLDVGSRFAAVRWARERSLAG